MFDASDSFDSSYAAALGSIALPLPPAATRCLRAAGSRDHAHAEAVRRSSHGAKSRACNRRARQLSAQAATEEANAADLTRETR
ncbi:MAG: hypothetical protein ABIP44_02760 [Pseudoxanthomonas sp.]